MLDLLPIYGKNVNVQGVNLIDGLRFLIIWSFKIFEGEQARLRDGNYNMFKIKPSQGNSRSAPIAWFTRKSVDVGCEPK